MELINLTNAIAALAFLALVVSFFGKYKDERNKWRVKAIISIIIGVAVLILSTIKNNQDDNLISISNSRADTIQQNLIQLRKSNAIISEKITTINTIKQSLDSIGLRLNEQSGKVSITDNKKLKSVILATKTGTNVLSVNQQGGQTARDITNN